MIALVDYKAGNLTSVKLAFEAIWEKTVATSDPAVIASADRVIFPGVGAAKSAMENLRSMGLVNVVKEAALSGKPFLGICLGMQILFEHSEEDGGVDTLGVIRGQVKRFPDVKGFKVPEIGWNQVMYNAECGVRSAEFLAQVQVQSPRKQTKDNSSLAEECFCPEFYFVHSYYAEVVPETVGVAEYAGVKFTAMVKKENLWACQFHPEKSGRIGLSLLSEWLTLR